MIVIKLDSITGIVAIKGMNRNFPDKSAESIFSGQYLPESASSSKMICKDGLHRR